MIGDAKRSILQNEKRFDTMNRLPDFIIISTQKSGSTFVNNCLREHPEIFMPRSEYICFEDPEYQQKS